MICMNYDHNKLFGLLEFHSGYEKINLNSPKGYSLKKTNAHTDLVIIYPFQIETIKYSSVTIH